MRRTVTIRTSKGSAGRRATAGAAPRGSLTVVGIGLVLVRHATLEAIEAIREADHVFHLLTHAAAVRWVEQLNSHATPLGTFLRVGKNRGRSYREMALAIAGAVRRGERVCAVFYGHPGVLVAASRDAIRRVQRDGSPARMLPGISAEDCLFADLPIHPRPQSWQCFEATDLLLRRRRFDPTVPMILWQAGVLGEASVRPDHQARPERVARLAGVLRRRYPANHPIVLYEASEFAQCDPVIDRVALRRLPTRAISAKTTLYIPPLPTTVQDTRVARWLMSSPGPA